MCVSMSVSVCVCVCVCVRVLIAMHIITVGQHVPAAVQLC